MEKPNNNLFVSELMTASPEIVLPNSSLRHVFKKMKARTCRQLPVMEDGKLVGIITDRDMRLALNESSMEKISWGNNARLDNLITKDYMTLNPTTVTPTTSAREAAKIMATRKIGALPVMENNTLVGIITITDFLNYFIR